MEKMLLPSLLGLVTCSGSFLNGGLIVSNSTEDYQLLSTPGEMSLSYALCIRPVRQSSGKLLIEPITTA